MTAELLLTDNVAADTVYWASSENFASSAASVPSVPEVSPKTISTVLGSSPSLSSVNAAPTPPPAEPLNQEIAVRFVSRQQDSWLPDGASWGLGWDTPSRPISSSGRFFSENSFGHLGYTGTSIWVDQEKDLTVILLTNRVHPSHENKKIQAFRPELHDLVFKEIVGESLQKT